MQQDTLQEKQIELLSVTCVLDIIITVLMWKLHIIFYTQVEQAEYEIRQYWVLTSNWILNFKTSFVFSTYLLSL